MAMITPTEHEKREWSRMAQAAYAAGYNAVGHRYSVSAAVVRIGEAMNLATFDELQSCYRSWLCWDDFKAADYACQPQTYSDHHLGDFAPG